MQTQLDQIQSAALAILPGLTRSTYAADVIMGYQEWSGSDLKGKAKAFGGSYARARSRARVAVQRAGGLILPTGCHGRLMLCASVGMDEWGNALFQTEAGPAVAGASSKLQLIE